MAHFRKRRRSRPRLGEGRKRPAPQPEPTPEQEYAEEDFEIEEFEDDYDDDFENDDVDVDEEPRPQRRKVAKKTTSRRQAPGRQGSRRPESRRQGQARTTRRSPNQRSSRLQSRGIRGGARGGVRRGVRSSQEERGSRLRGKYGGGYQSQKTPIVAWISLGGFFGYWIFALIAVLALGRAVMQGGMTNEKVVALGTGVLILAVFAWLSVITGLITGIIAVCMKNRPKVVGTIGLVMNALLLIYTIARSAMKDQV